MTNLSFFDFEKRIDALTTALLVPLRTSKTVDQTAMNSIKQLLSEFRAMTTNESMVPKALVGKLFFVFTSMLSEAAHAKNPAPIIAAAWDIEEQLTKIFGPHFD